MQLILKVSTINAVRDDVLGHPLSHIIAALGTDFGHLGHLAKVRLDPLLSVVSFGNIRGLVVEPAITCYIASAIL